MVKPKDDAAARSARAAELRKAVEQAITGKPATDTDRKTPESPREFIHHRMNETSTKEP